MEYKKISELTTVVTGGTPSTKVWNYWNNGTIPWLQSGCCQNCDVCSSNNFITQDGYDNSSAKMMPKNTVMIALTGATAGKIGFLRFEACGNQSITGILPCNDLNQRFLYYFLISQRPKILNDCIGGAQLHISQAYVKNILIPILPLSRQNEIVDKLTKIEVIISLRYKQLKKLDELVKARFVELFGDPEKNTFSWKEEELSKHLTVIGGYAFKSEQFSEEGIPVLRIGNINAGFFKPVNLVYWEDDDALNRYKMYPGDLVMSLTGTVGKDDYGNVCILGNDYDVYYLNQRNAKLELQDTINKYYLSMLLKFEPVKKKLTGISRGVRQANISNKDILNLPVPIPPIELQNQFAAFVEQTDKSKLEVQKSLEKLELLKKALMQKYFG